jgi:hypothetical protein
MPRRSGQVSNNNEQADGENPVSQDPVKLDKTEEPKQNKLSMSSLKDLAFLGRLTRKEVIGGFTFEISTLNINEQKSIMRKIMTSEEVDRLLDIRPLTLSFSLRTINGVPLADLCEDTEIISDEDKRLSVVLGLQLSVVERLHRVHEELTKTSSKEVGLEELKK